MLQTPYKLLFLQRDLHLLVAIDASTRIIQTHFILEQALTEFAATSLDCDAPEKPKRRSKTQPELWLGNSGNQQAQWRISSLTVHQA